MNIKEKILKLRICEMCGELFEININNKKSNIKRFCSSTCAKKHNGLNNKGKKRSDDCKKLMSLNRLGENNYFYGKKHSKSSIEKMSISSQWLDDKYKFCNMTDIEKEIFDGIMISDGSLSKSRISARLTLGFKYIETIERIINDLPSINFLKPWNSKTFNKIQNKTYSHSFTKSNSYRDLLFEYERWYKNNKKIIPLDFKFTKISFYWWYVCDGYISSRNNVYFCTDCFDNEYLIFISNKITEFGFKNNITSRKRIRLFKKDSKEFLDWISSDIEIQKEYLYKWKIKNN